MSETVATMENLRLSQLQRIGYIFTVPSKTFTDILQNRTWWLPFLLLTLASYLFSGVVVSKVGLNRLAESTLTATPEARERFQSASPEIQEQTRRYTLNSLEIGFIIGPILLLGMAAVMALVLVGTLNFMLGARATYGELFAALLYASLIEVPKPLLGASLLLGGMDPETFNISNPVGTNVAYYVPVESAEWLKSLLASVDIVTIWYVVVLIIACSVLAKVKRSHASIVVLGWWFLIIVVTTAWKAFI